MLYNKVTTEQSAGMEDGLIDLIVVRLLVKMATNESDPGMAPSETSREDSYSDWYWDPNFDFS